MKVLLFSNDTMPFGSLPTSGGGLRCWQIYQGLKSKGIDVVASMPAFTFLTKKYFSEIPEDVRENLWEWHTQDTILERVKPDAVIYSSNWDHYNLAKKPSVPLVIDLHGSRLIETSLWGHPADTNKKVEVFSKADSFICAGKRQRMYFYGWLTQAGKIPEQEHLIHYIPISLSPEEFKRNELSYDDSQFPLFVSGGGWFPWQDQSNAIFTICNEVIKRKKGLVSIYGTPHENNSVSPEERRIRNIFSEIKNLSSKHDQVEVPGYVGREELLAKYSRASVAIELMKYNLERELAFTTRTIEYLWCGLPVIYNSYSEISDHIRDYNAGWALDPENEQSLVEVLEEIYQNPQVIKEKSANAVKLVKDRFSWDKTIKPLTDFLENPEVLTESKPAKGYVFNRAPYFSPRGAVVNFGCKSGDVIRQLFSFPAEGIWALEVPYKKISGSQADLTVNLKIFSKKGFKIGSIKYTNNDMHENGVFVVPISRIFRPMGGSDAQIELKIEAEKNYSEPLFLCTGFQKEVYPLVSSSSVKMKKGQDVMGEEVNPEVLQLRFYPGHGRMYHLRSMFERGIWLVKQGEFRRVFNAVLRKAPSGFSRIKAKLQLKGSKV